MCSVRSMDPITVFSSTCSKRMHVFSFTILRTWERVGEVVRMFPHTNSLSSVHKILHILVQRVRNWARPETLKSLPFFKNSCSSDRLIKLVTGINFFLFLNCFHHYQLDAMNWLKGQYFSTFPVFWPYARDYG